MRSPLLDYWYNLSRSSTTSSWSIAVYCVYVVAAIGNYFSNFGSLALHPRLLLQLSWFLGLPLFLLHLLLLLHSPLSYIQSRSYWKDFVWKYFEHISETHCSAGSWQHWRWSSTKQSPPRNYHCCNRRSRCPHPGCNYCPQTKKRYHLHDETGHPKSGFLKCRLNRDSMRKRRFSSDIDRDGESFPAAAHSHPNLCYYLENQHTILTQSRYSCKWGETNRLHDIAHIRSKSCPTQVYGSDELLLPLPSSCKAYPTWQNHFESIS